MNTSTLLFSVTVAFGVFLTVLFAFHLYSSIIWVTNVKDKLKDKCQGSGSFMMALSFFGAIVFLVLSIPAGCIGMAMMLSKDYEKVRKILIITIASSVILAIIQSVAMLIAIAAKLKIKCLKDNINNQFIISLVLILVNVVISPLFMFLMFMKTSFVESERGSEHGGKTPISGSSYNPYNPYDLSTEIASNTRMLGNDYYSSIYSSFVESERGSERGGKTPISASSYSPYNPYNFSTEIASNPYSLSTEIASNTMLADDYYSSIYSSFVEPERGSEREGKTPISYSSCNPYNPYDLSTEIASNTRMLGNDYYSSIYSSFVEPERGSERGGKTPISYSSYNPYDNSKQSFQIQ